MLFFLVTMYGFIHVAIYLQIHMFYEIDII